MKLEMEKRPQIEREIAGALRATIDAHGPIGPEEIGSASKRIVGVLKSIAREQSRDEIFEEEEWKGKCKAPALRQALRFWVTRAERFEEQLPDDRKYMAARGVLHPDYAIGQEAKEGNA